MRRIAFALIALCVVAAGSGSAQQQPSTGVGHNDMKKPQSRLSVGMTNEDVLELVKAGFSDDLIVARIGQASAKSFQLSARALVSLKASGVSEKVISAMLGIEPAVAPTTSAHPQVVSPAPSSTDAWEGVEAGIHLEKGDQLVPLEPTTFSGGRSGGLFKSALTYGLAKSSWKAVVRSPHAQLRVSNAPVFYFHFEYAGSGLSHTGGGFASLLSVGATSPNEFVLARMATKKRERELIIGEAWAFGATSGTRSQDTVELKVERLRPGLYRVTPAQPLEPGEYCFFHAASASQMGSAGSGKLFDFGVDDGSL